MREYQPFRQDAAQTVVAEYCLVVLKTIISQLVDVNADDQSWTLCQWLAIDFWRKA